MTTYKYELRGLPLTDTETLELLQQTGAKGWRLAAVLSASILLEREAEEESLPDPSPRPIIACVQPTFFRPSEEIVIHGEYFGPQPGSILLTGPDGRGLGGTLRSWSETEIQLLLPSQSTGTTSLRIETDAGVSDPFVFSLSR